MWRISTPVDMGVFHPVRIAVVDAHRSEGSQAALHDGCRFRPIADLRDSGERCSAASPEQPFEHSETFFGSNIDQRSDAETVLEYTSVRSVKGRFLERG